MTTDRFLETEIKIALDCTPGKAREQILQARFTPIRPRLLEKNTVWDRETGELKKRDVLLRLRYEGETATLTVKRPPAQPLPGVKTREEYETTVGNGPACQAALEALGYRVVFVYEKYREVFARSDLRLMLDETPIGLFLEIEGERSRILACAAEFGAPPAPILTQNYLTLFKQRGGQGAMTFPP